MKHNRHSIRLQGYDYASEGLYFLTICCKDRQHLLGEIRDAEMMLNEVGEMVKESWLETETIRENCRIHEFVIMPNHLHGILEITGSLNPILEEQALNKFISPSGTVGSIVRGFKINAIKKIREIVGRGELQFAPTALKIIELDFKIWQRNYYDHIIRNEESLRKIVHYIQNNPGNWLEDEYFR
jgi:putative transposase